MINSSAHETISGHLLRRPVGLRHSYRPFSRPLASGIFYARSLHLEPAEDVDDQVLSKIRIQLVNWHGTGTPDRRAKGTPLVGWELRRTSAEILTSCRAVHPSKTHTITQHSE